MLSIVPSYKEQFLVSYACVLMLVFLCLCSYASYKCITNYNIIDDTNA